MVAVVVCTPKMDDAINEKENNRHKAVMIRMSIILVEMSSPIEPPPLAVVFLFER